LPAPSPREVKDSKDFQKMISRAKQNLSGFDDLAEYVRMGYLSDCCLITHGGYLKVFDAIICSTKGSLGGKLSMVYRLIGLKDVKATKRVLKLM